MGFPTKGGKSMESSISPEFRCIISKQMVGILISVWVRNDLRTYIRSPNVSCVGCGIIGCLGNKVRNSGHTSMVIVKINL